MSKVTSFKDKIGTVYNDFVDMQEDFEVELEGEVFWSDMYSVPFSPSAKRVDFYNDAEPREGYTLEFVNMQEDEGISWDDAALKLVDVF